MVIASGVVFDSGLRSLHEVQIEAEHAQTVGGRQCVDILSFSCVGRIVYWPCIGRGAIVGDVLVLNIRHVIFVD